MTAVATADAAGPAPPRALRGLRDRLRSDPGSVVVPIAAVLVLGQLVLRGWAAAGGFYLLDDFVFIDRAVSLPFDLRIFEAYNGHVMPGSFALVEALTALAPLSWPAVVALGLAQQLAIDAALLALLVLLFGRRPAVLVPFALYVTSSITLPAFLWWAAALNQLPMQLAVLLALLYHVRYLRSGELRDALRSAAAVAAGLLFSEKTLLALPLLVALTLFWFTEGGPLARLRRTLGRHRTAWLVHGALGGAYSAYYVLNVDSPIVGTPTLGEVGDLFGPALLRSVLPGLLGGPWVWEDFPPTLAIADPPAVLQWLSVGVAAVVVAVSVLRRRGAGRAWVLLALYVVGTCVLLSASRAQLIGPFALAREYRYFTDVAMVGALCLALAFLPVREAPTVLRKRALRLPRAVLGAGAALRRVPLLPAAAGALAVLVLATGSVVSTVNYAQRWHENPARPFVDNARTDLATRPGTVLIDGIVPDPVQWHVLGNYALASSLLAGAPEARFLHDGESAPAPAMLDEQGHVQPAWVPPLTSAVPGPTPDCGWLVFDRPVPIPLQFGGVGPWSWVVRVVWLSSTDNTGWIAAGDQRVPVALPAGLHEVFVQVSGAVSTVTVELAAPTAPVCVPQIEIGSAQPVPPGLR
ncbi:hypothetical protein [Pseudonocardia humida]|uniref:4-amino-4-deoxy-L-arabinose transferase-like glycosyltransferase n=1 Tax=Pseudonocardia humida TaxID=2800819 RepID=A0ABT0ZZK2_9PSEU|nr:hypothetical protein [Pseudonocardia humida]MCO1656176.1 hypothetical protein [Pseudonocardia humida]